MKWMIVLALFTACVAMVSCRGGSRRGSDRCDFSTDCADDECCVARSTLQLERGGKCRPLSSRGEKCNSVAISEYGEKYLRNCPCKSGFTCGGNGRQSSLRNRCVRDAPTTTSTASPTTSETTAAETTPTTAPTTTENPTTV